MSEIKPDSREPASKGTVVDCAPETPNLRTVQLIRKVAILLALLLLVVLAAVSRSSDDMDGNRHETIETIGRVAIIIAIFGRAWCSLYIGGRKKAEIVDRGPYSISRNPLYVFSFLGAFGVGAQSGTLTIATLFVLAAVLVFHFTVRREEIWLDKEFGETYRQYCARTPRFWPNFTRWSDVEELTIRPKFFLLTIRDGLVFLLAIPVFEMIDFAQILGVLNVFMRLP
ncbi:methyltransferase family protein [Brevundimonas nasdae]|uniref:Isoprenylcysteine carboxylmethyltransferase family protein n=1 Tax=Brevundimonas nasdae TaxID=172043 RepID=A0ABX8TH79_9CAUL|nr:isoprenylcysteine carboxylmethyltransferase family protein [Brevundimonas nasdae]QYC10023.1 isoprenylcysteine carboxylmethyltransferase family protein [Brevundimonas nasdae]QYC12813.1 isoprenylcysteine carboxylmethyltransferase family protein [Brevundimonas nasdae]